MFGSTDNIAILNNLDKTQGGEGAIPGAIKTPKAGTSQSNPMYGTDHGSSAAPSSVGAPGETPTSTDSSPDHAQASGFHVSLCEIQTLWEKQDQLEKSIKNLKAYYQRKYKVIVEVLEEQRCRCSMLEEQLFDLIELHQNEILNLKEELADMEEKMDYQCETGKDMHEALWACQTRISRMELQQQQQVVQLEGLESTAGRMVLGKVISVLLAFMSTVANCVNTSGCMFSILLFVLLSLLWRHWDVVVEYHHHLFHPRTVAQK